MVLKQTKISEISSLPIFVTGSNWVLLPFIFPIADADVVVAVLDLIWISLIWIASFLNPLVLKDIISGRRIAIFVELHDHSLKTCKSEGYSNEANLSPDMNFFLRRRFESTQMTTQRRLDRKKHARLVQKGGESQTWEHLFNILL